MKKIAKNWSKIGMSTIAFILISIFSMGTLFAQSAPSNRLVVIMDSSGSFKTRQSEALNQVIQMLDSMSEKKLHRWENNTGEIIILAMDAMPEVVWKGSLRDLKALEPKNWAERFKARSDLSYCTDVLGAFNLATTTLTEGHGNVSKYLFVFSDLIHEPPTNSVNKCMKPDNNPPEGFPWNEFSDVSVNMFWVPANNKLIWQREINAHGLEKNFKLFSTTQSSIIDIEPPPQPERKYTDEDKLKAKNTAIKAGKFAGKIVFYGVSGIFGIVFICVIAARFKKGKPRQQTTRRFPVPPPQAGNPAGGARPIRQPVINNGRQAR